MASQVEGADLLVLIKVDLVAEVDRERIKAALGPINPRAEIVFAREGAIDRSQLPRKAGKAWDPTFPVTDGSKSSS